jgi:REP element-mobilizing transposase RayT
MRQHGAAVIICSLIDLEGNMARPLRIECEGAVYHVTARGNERKRIFFAKGDYERFKEYLTVARERFGCFLHGYVLMGNHYHLILETPEGNLSRVMHYLNGSYTTYLNARRKRCGHLFQGRYKSILVDKDSYLMELSRYVHLNPVRAGIVERPEGYAYSSYQAFVGKEKEPFLAVNPLLAVFATKTSTARSRYREFVESAITADLPNPLADVYGGMILGREDFIKSVLGRLDDGDIQRTEVSHRKALQATNGADILLEQVAAHLEHRSFPTEQSRAAMFRKIGVYLLKKHTALGNREIGEKLGGLSYSGVSKCYGRMCEELQRDKELRRGVDRLTVDLSNVKG